MRIVKDECPPGWFLYLTPVSVEPIHLPHAPCGSSPVNAVTGVMHRCDLRHSTMGVCQRYESLYGGPWYTPVVIAAKEKPRQRQSANAAFLCPCDHFWSLAAGG
jgi:hypothetical protein